MNKIEATIRKSKFKEVKKALIDGGFNFFNYRLTRSISKSSETRFYRGVKFGLRATDRILLSIYVADKQIDAVINLIKDSGLTGDADDSFLVVFKAKKAYKIEGGSKDNKLIEII